MQDNAEYSSLCYERVVRAANRDSVSSSLHQLENSHFITSVVINSRKETSSKLFSKFVREHLSLYNTKRMHLRRSTDRIEVCAKERVEESDRAPSVTTTTGLRCPGIVARRGSIGANNARVIKSFIAVSCNVFAPSSCVMLVEEERQGERITRVISRSSRARLFFTESAECRRDPRGVCSGCLRASARSCPVLVGRSSVRARTSAKG